MMYNQKLAIALKSAGKVLREFKDEVYVPFGTEYSILIKNLNTVRALVTVSVDGEDVGEGTKFIIDANDSIDLERFVKNGNYDAGNRFKFIERTSKIEDHRGIGVEDGLVRVEFQFEKPAVSNYYIRNTPPHYNDFWYHSTLIGSSNTGGQQATYTTTSGPVVTNANVVNTSVVNTSVNASLPVEDSLEDDELCRLDEDEPLEEDELCWLDELLEEDELC